MKRNCVYCDHPISGRSDKKFCGDSCRNTYNNYKNRKRNLVINHHHSRLKKNHRILAELLGDETEKKVFKRTLLDTGFDLQSVSSYYSDQQGNVYFFVYEIGYSILDEQIVQLTKSKGRSFEAAGLTG